MDSYQGDLADMVRASSRIIGAATTVSTRTPTATSTATTNDEQTPTVWQFGSSNPDLCPFPELLLTNNIDATTSTGLVSPFIDIGLEDPQSTTLYGGGGLMNNFNIFSRALQISSDIYSCTNNDSNNTCGNNNNNNNNAKSPIITGDLPRVMKKSCGLISNEMMNVNGSSTSNTKDEYLDNNCTSGVQIPSIRNPGIKRRKSQAKKVVCIPAPTGAYSRQSGEVVPSDLWAWRKYGQKPIKDSPYPRGYYRCSSSKGCSARKQVERSRTDPNMLVITYTSEHNHPWPTQRNALAGSTRSQPSKITPAVVASSTPLPMIGSNEVLVKEEISNKEEMKTEKQQLVEEKEEECNNNAENFGSDQGQDNVSLACQSYRPIMHQLNGKQPQQDFLVELGFEAEDDPLNLIFTQQTKPLDPFSNLFD